MKLKRTIVRYQAKKIWDIDNIIQSDGALPPGWLSPGDEIHPDLIRYKGYWYCGLKEGPPALRHPRWARIIRSADGEQWESVKRIDWAGGHVADLKFSVTGDGMLMVHTMVCDMSIPQGAVIPQDPDRPEHGLIKRMSVTWLTRDGLDWGSMYACPTGYNTTRYDVTWFRGMGYSLAYSYKDTRGTLYRTGDGKSWRALMNNVYGGWSAPKLAESDLPVDDQRLKYVAWENNQQRRGVDVNNLALEDRRGGFAFTPPSEAALAFEPDGTAVALVRAHPVFAILGTAPAPFYDQWTWRATRVDWNNDGKLRPAGELLGVQMGGPILRRLSDGRLIAAGRADSSTATEGLGRLTLFEVDVANAILKRFGDFDGYSHYPGVVEHEGELWITCGKQQRQDAFGVYLLKAGVPGAICDQPKGGEIGSAGQIAKGDNQ